MSDTLLEVRDLRVHFKRRRMNPFKPAETVFAVDGVSLSIPKGKTLGLVGESGSGKTTVARAILRLVPISGGSILYQRP
jgi:peptide/nickel transport system ATP-binding protein